MPWGCGLLAVMLLVSATHAAEPVRLTSDGLLKQRPVWLADNRQLVFSRHEDDTIRLYVLDTETGVEQRLTDRDVPEYDAVPTPDGKSFLLAFDKISPNQGDIDIARWLPESKTFEPLIVTGEKLSHEEWPACSPDGQHIAYTSTRDGNQELYVADSNGQNSSRLTQDPAHDAHPCWSPDGKSIAFATNRWGDLEIALISPNGSNLRRITDSVGLDDYPAISPDGTKLAFTTNRRGGLDVAIVELAGGRVTLATDDEAIDNFPTWSQDGRLTFVSDRDGGFEIYVMKLEP
jgi:TolB protein